MESIEIINFINKHAGAEFFEQDKELFRKLFPQSKILGELERANQFNKKHLDERMLLQIGKCVCAESILENRDKVDKKKSAPSKAKATQVRAPKADASKAKKSKAKTPEVEEPKADASKAKESKAKTPEVEEPKADASKADESKKKEEVQDQNTPASPGT
jgi:hypothetical protein